MFASTYIDMSIHMSKLDSKIDRIHFELSRNGQSNKISDSEALDIHVTVDHCYNCRKEVHNLRAQANGLCDEEDELRMYYCSMICKRM